VLERKKQVDLLSSKPSRSTERVPGHPGLHRVTKKQTIHKIYICYQQQMNSVVIAYQNRKEKKNNAFIHHEQQSKMEKKNSIYSRFHKNKLLRNKITQEDNYLYTKLQGNNENKWKEAGDRGSV
jgi:23S rRNA G2069 N7-methylase RlmK/C1962 C5-methylase RlmI